MPAKSRRNRSRQAAAQRGQRRRPDSLTTPAATPAAAPAAPAVTITPRTVPVNRLRNPYIASELKTIGVLAVLMLAVLFLLKLVLD